MNAQYLYDSAGRWIAYRVGVYVFDTDGNCVGWTPWNDEEVVDRFGEYLGTIYYGDRLYRDMAHEYRGFPGYLESPEYPGFPGWPPQNAPTPPPANASDVVLNAA